MANTLYLTARGAEGCRFLIPIVRPSLKRFLLIFLFLLCMGQESFASASLRCLESLSYGRGGFGTMMTLAALKVKSEYGEASYYQIEKDLWSLSEGAVEKISRSRFQLANELLLAATSQRSEALSIQRAETLLTGGIQALALTSRFPREVENQLLKENGMIESLVSLSAELLRSATPESNARLEAALLSYESFLKDLKAHVASSNLSDGLMIWSHLENTALELTSHLQSLLKSRRLLVPQEANEAFIVL